jgi:hypothetical protein
MKHLPFYRGFHGSDFFLSVLMKAVKYDEAEW